MQLPPDRPLEEPTAAITRRDSIMPPIARVSTNQTRGPGWFEVNDQVRCLVEHLLTWSSGSKVGGAS